MKLSLDYETRSECDLKLAGAYVYARHPSTRVLCAAYSIDEGPVKYWAAWAGQKIPADLGAALMNQNCEIHAWNSQFERLITHCVMRIHVHPSRYRCTAAWARCSGLPGKLETALEYVGEAKQLASKRDGYRVMMKWCQLLPGGGWADDKIEYLKLVSYCMDDVRSEMRLQALLAGMPMSQGELADFALCEEINDRGLPIDVDLALAAQAYGELERAELSEVLYGLTDGEITSTSQHARVKAYLERVMGSAAFLRFFEQRYEKNGETVTKVSTDKRSRAEFLLSSEAAEYPEAVEVVELVDDASKSSVAKYEVMAARAADTGRAEGSYLAFGAIQTKRYSSRGVQAHNFPRDVPQDVPEAVQAVLEHRVEGQVMHVLSSLLRPAIKAPEGRVLVWGDWTAVEARGMPWLADCEWKLGLYRDGTDVYRVNATDIYGTPYEEVPDDERQIGKVSELALQFGGAVGALKAMARNYGIGLTEGAAARIVARWREANLWAASFSYRLYNAFMLTVAGNDSSHASIRYRRIAPLLHGTISIACDLPGGVTLYYHGIKGKVVMSGQRVNSWDTDVTYAKSGAAHFRTERIWHGLLAENGTQALCAALLRDCLKRVNAALKGLDAFIIGHTHDEIILESSTADAGRAEKVLLHEMLRVPEWLTGFPLGCEVKSGPRYTK